MTDPNKLNCFTLKHEKTEARKYVTYDGPDGFRYLLSEEDQKMSGPQARAKARYGSLPPYFRFGGQRDPCYWCVADVAAWIYKRYAEVRPDLVIAAEKDGYIHKELPASKESAAKARSSKKRETRNV